MTNPQVSTVHLCTRETGSWQCELGLPGGQCGWPGNLMLQKLWWVVLTLKRANCFFFFFNLKHSPKYDQFEFPQKEPCVFIKHPFYQKVFFFFQKWPVKPLQPYMTWDDGLGTAGQNHRWLRVLWYLWKTAFDRLNVIPNSLIWVWTAGVKCWLVQLEVCTGPAQSFQMQPLPTSLE